MTIVSRLDQLVCIISEQIHQDMNPRTYERVVKALAKL